MRLCFLGLGVVFVLACGEVVPLKPDAAIDAAPISLTVSPATASVDVRATQQFMADVTNGSGGVTWAVNGVAGGNAMVGLINATGLYTAPARRPRPINVMITATSVDDTSKTADAAVTITAQGVAYVTEINSRVVIFDGVRTRNGDIAPTRTIAGATTQLSYAIGATIDVAHDRLFVGNYSSQSIVTFNGLDTVTGDVAPNTKLTSSASPMTGLENVELDPQRNLIYALNQAGDIRVFDAATQLNGDFAPLRSFKDPTQAAGNDRRTYLDVANNRLYATQVSGGTVFIFDNASTANGAVAATRKLVGAMTTISCPWGVALDAKRDLLYVSDYCTNNIKVFANASTVNGDVAPMHTITGMDAGSSPEALSVDPETDCLAVQYQDQGVFFFDAASTLDGPQVSARSVKGPATTITGTQGMYMDWDR
jgi:hypothetical protein